MSAEFLVLVALVALIFLVLSVVLRGQETNLLQIKDALSSQRNAYALSSALNYVCLAGDGATYNLSFSGKAQDENITFFAHSVESKRGRAVSSAPLLCGNISGSAVENGNMLISNSNGGITLGH